MPLGFASIDCRRASVLHPLDLILSGHGRERLLPEALQQVSQRFIGLAAVVARRAEFGEHSDTWARDHHAKFSGQTRRQAPASAASLSRMYSMNANPHPGPLSRACGKSERENLSQPLNSVTHP